MSDTRRRRKSNQSCGSDDLSDSYEELNATKETQSSEQTDGHQDSECDIYASDSEAESQEGAQRESGDGQEEEKPQKKLDDDEDRRNPQYIPKRGTFYEHDDRTADEVTDNNVEPPSERETKEKKVWKDKEDRWDHDRYNDEEQAPKSHEELIAVYGYDIRNEEGPPRARRRRRYGRGPNKYTRNWEDEDAYGKTISSSRGGTRRFNRSGEEFPALATNKDNASHVEEPVISSAWYSSKNKTPNKAQNFPPLQAQQDSPKTKSTGGTNVHTNENKTPNESPNSVWKKDSKHSSQGQSSNGNNGPGGDAEKITNTKVSPRENNKRNIQESVSLAASRARGRGFKANANNNVTTSRPMDGKPKGRGAGAIVADGKRNSTQQNDDEQQLVHEMKHVTVNDGAQYHQSGRHNKNFYGQTCNQQRSSTIPPRMQQQQQPAVQQQQQQQQQQQDSSGNRPKRYSSLRQRPAIADNPGQQNYPPQHGQHAQHGQHGYFPPQAGNSRGVLDSQGYPQGHFEQPASVPAAPAPMAGQPVISLPPSGQPASYAPPPFLVPPPQFIPPQTAPPSIINYVPGPNGPAFQPNFQGYQGYSPPVQPQGPPPPQELFQPQGCTYYSPAQQQKQQQQSAPMRRPKAAIPILPPPDNQQHQSSRGRGRNIQQHQQAGQGQVQGQGQGQPGVSPQQMEQGASVEEAMKAVPGQFDNAQIEESGQDQQRPSKDEEPSVLPSPVIENEDKNVSSENMIAQVDGHVEIDEQVDGPSVDSEHGSSENVQENKSIAVPRSVSSPSPKTENELNKCEGTAVETTVVDEAAA